MASTQSPSNTKSTTKSTSGWSVSHRTLEPRNYLSSTVDDDDDRTTTFSTTQQTNSTALRSPNDLINDAQNIQENKITITSTLHVGKLDTSPDAILPIHEKYQLHTSTEKNIPYKISFVFLLFLYCF